MKIGIDFDDVLIDFNTGFAEYHNTTYGTAVAREDIYAFDAEQIYGITREEFLHRLHEFMLSDKHIETAPVTGVKEALTVLGKQHELCIVTSRSKTLSDLTEAWLQKNLPGMFKVTHYTNQFPHNEGIKKSKAEVCDEEGIEIFIEDSPVQVQVLINGGKKVLLFNTPWNQGVLPSSLITRVFSWKDIVERIQDLST